MPQPVSVCYRCHDELDLPVSTSPFADCVFHSNKLLFCNECADDIAEQEVYWFCSSICTDFIVWSSDADVLAPSTFPFQSSSISLSTSTTNSSSGRSGSSNSSSSSSHRNRRNSGSRSRRSKNSKSTSTVPNTTTTSTTLKTITAKKSGSSSSYSSLINAAAHALSSARYILVTAGAGMSCDSGLPDFRGKNGFYRVNHQDINMLHVNFHEHEPVRDRDVVEVVFCCCFSYFYSRRVIM